MKILLSNDDGITTSGLKALIKPLQVVGHEVFVAAPEQENSAVSHAITIHDPIFVDKYNFDEFPDVVAWSISGRPADCVKIALEVLLKDNLPDLVISGINRGPNLGMDTIYSGTVSAALEASMHNIPAIAVSLEDKDCNADYTVAANVVVKVLQNYAKLSLPKSSTLNINVPAVAEAELKGICVTKLGDIAYDNFFEQRKNLRGRTYYWLGGEIIHDEVSPDDISTDVAALKNKWVAITPLQHDLTDQKTLAKLHGLIL